MAEGNGSRISRDTLVPIGSAAAVVLSIITGIVIGMNKLSDVQRAIGDIRWTIENATAYRWDSNNEREIWHQFEKMNRATYPDMKAPDVSAVLRDAELARNRKSL